MVYRFESVSGGMTGLVEHLYCYIGVEETSRSVLLRLNSRKLKKSRVWGAGAWVGPRPLVTFSYTWSSHTLL